MKERDWQDQVLELARLYRWRSYHTFDSRRSNPGFPDLVLVRAPRLIFAELKAQKGRVTTEQKLWMAALGDVGEAVDGAVGRAQAVVVDDPETPEPSVEVYLWRPADFEAVHDALRR